jgi:hypothetical protein
MINCWRYRRIISRSADENAPLPPAAQAHVARCPACRRVFVTEHEIVRGLSSGAAARKRRQPPPSLHAGIMARIASLQAGARRPSKGSLLRRPLAMATTVSERLRFQAAVLGSRLRRPLALATACIVLAAFLFWPARSGLKPSPARIVQVQPPPRVKAASPMDWPDAALLTQWATNLDQPLQTEMQAVFHDARGAVNALADNFIPEKLRHTLLAQTSSQN